MSATRNFSEWVRSYRNGFGRRPTAGESGPIVLRIADVSSGSIDLRSPRRGYVSPAEAATYTLEIGDLLFVRVNGAREIVGRCCVVDETVPRDTLFNDHLIRVQLKPGLDPEFARLCMSLPKVRAVIEEAASTSAGQLSINQQLLDSLEIPHLPLDAQRRIASRAKAERVAIEEARLAAQAQRNETVALRAAFYSEGFAGVVPVATTSEFQEAPIGWHWTKLTDVARLESGHAAVLRPLGAGNGTRGGQCLCPARGGGAPAEPV